jgi:hypothetical protein
MAAPFLRLGDDLDPWEIDLEWYKAAGCLPRPRLFTTVEHGTGRTVKLGEKELARATARRLSGSRTAPWSQASASPGIWCPGEY